MSRLQKGLKRYLTDEQITRIANFHVGIAGAGGLGSNVAYMLVRSGFRCFTIADFDKVEDSNLNRQFFLPEDCGQYKVNALGNNLKKIEPQLSLDLKNEKVSKDNAEKLFLNCNCVVEAFDNADTKAMFYALLGRDERLYVGASGLSGWGDEEMKIRKFSKSSYIIGDFSSVLSKSCPPMAPRVIQAASMQANLVLKYVLDKL